MKTAVIGIGFGDEGKGCTVNWLCSLNPDTLVARYSGGHQAGHHAINSETGQEHIFSNFGSGTLYGNASYYGERCTIDPIGIRIEYQALRKLGLHPKLIINANCPVVTLMDKFANIENKETRDHGSCGIGFFETLKRQKAMYSLVAEDLIFPDIFPIKYGLIENYYGLTLASSHKDSFIRAAHWLKANPAIQIVQNIPKSNNIIYESSQGLLLDKDIGFFPHVTPSSVGHQYFREENIEIDHTYFVTRAYQTRHGNGPMTQSHSLMDLSKNFDKTNQPNAYQKAMRATILDLDLLKYGLVKNKSTAAKHTLVITCLEHLNSFKYIDKGELYQYVCAESFCRNIGMVLGFSNVIMCKNYEFLEVY